MLAPFHDTVARRYQLECAYFNFIIRRWCLYLHHLAGKGYDLIRDSCCISLRELLGIMKEYEPWQRLVGLTMDEMYICEGVVYDKHSGHITGFTDTGDINNHLERCNYSR